MYARQLSFLLATSAPAPTQSSIEEEGQSQVTDGTPEIEIAPEKRRKTTRVSGRQRLEESLIQFMNTPVPVESEKTSNPNLAFFESLLPALGSFTIDEQLEFQTEVLNVVKRIRGRSTGFLHPSSHYPCQSPSNARYPNVPSSFPQMQQYSSFPNYPTSTFPQRTHPQPSASSITFRNIQASPAPESLTETQAGLSDSLHALVKNHLRCFLTVNV